MQGTSFLLSPTVGGNKERGVTEKNSGNQPFEMKKAELAMWSSVIVKK